MPKTDDWTTVRVPVVLERRARRIRDMLLKEGDTVLPARWRGRLEIPTGAPAKVAARKLGIGQVLALAMDVLEREVERGRAR